MRYTSQSHVATRLCCLLTLCVLCLQVWRDSHVSSMTEAECRGGHAVLRDRLAEQACKLSGVQWLDS